MEVYYIFSIVHFYAYIDTYFAGYIIIIIDKLQVMHISLNKRFYNQILYKYRKNLTAIFNSTLYLHLNYLQKKNDKKMSWTSDLLSVITIIIISIYIYYQYIFGYWKRRGIPYIKPSFPFGNLGSTILQKISMSELVQQFYDHSTESMIGVYGLMRPLLLIRDTNLIRQILIKDFQYFVDRGVYIDEKHDPLSGHLFSLAGEKWKNLRVKLTPVFTSGKLKAMFTTILDCGGTLVNYMDGIADCNGIEEMRELSARYTTNIIASVAFGNDIDSIAKPDTSFRRYGRKVQILLIIKFPNY